MTRLEQTGDKVRSEAEVRAVTRQGLKVLGVSDATVERVLAEIDADAEDTASAFADCWDADDWEMCAVRTIERLLTEGLDS